jgi:predicted Zn-dependent peptidase
VSSPVGVPRRDRHHGLSILHDPMPGPLTALALVARAGSRFDGAHPGVAHMAEHMLFQGTRRSDQADLNRRAALLGGDVDAETGHDDLILSIEVFNEDVEPALALLAELCFESTIPDARFPRERRVVLDEIRGRRDDPANIVFEAGWSRLFDGGLGHPICGTLGSVRAIPAAAVRRFVRRHVTPANMVLGATGGVTRGALRRAIGRTFPRVAAGGAARARAPRADRRGGRLRIRRRDALQAQLVRLAPAPHAPRAHLALALAMEILGSDPDARLYQEVRERLGLGYEVSADVEIGMGWAASVVSATTGPHDAARLEATVTRVLDGGAAGFTREELERARRKLRHRQARLADSRLDRAVAHAARAVAGRPPVAETAQLLGRITLPEVEASWRAHLRAPTLTCVLTP